MARQVLRHTWPSERSLARYDRCQRRDVAADGSQVTLRGSKRPRDGTDRQHFREAKLHFREAKLAGRAKGQELVICVLKRESRTISQNKICSHCIPAGMRKRRAWLGSPSQPTHRPSLDLFHFTPFAVACLLLGTFMTGNTGTGSRNSIPAL